MLLQVTVSTKRFVFTIIEFYKEEYYNDFTDIRFYISLYLRQLNGYCIRRIIIDPPSFDQQIASYSYHSISSSIEDMLRIVHTPVLTLGNKVLSSYTNVLAANFRTLKPQDYLINQRESQLARRPHIKVLSPLQNANQGDSLVSDEIRLIGVPKGRAIEPHEELREMVKSKKAWYMPNQPLDFFQSLLYENQSDLLFLQIDPSPYIARERFLAHKCALNEIEDYRKDGVMSIDPHKPISWQETVVNLLTLDLLSENTVPSPDKNFKGGLYTYSYPYLQPNSYVPAEHQIRTTKLDKNQGTQALTQRFVQTVSTCILDGQRTGFDLMDKVLYTGLMSKQKVMLGGMPESLYRMILGGGLSVQEIRDIFRMVVKRNRQLTFPMSSLKEAAEMMLPHIFQLPKDLYLTAMLKQSFQAAMQMIAFVGMSHWRPIQQYWVGPPHGINMTQATSIGLGVELEQFNVTAGESISDKIEKQAILDVLMETRHWSKSYLANPFPYLCEDITKVSESELGEWKSTFMKFYKLYGAFRDKQYAFIEHKTNESMKLLMGTEDASKGGNVKDNSKSGVNAANKKNQQKLILLNMKRQQELEEISSKQSRVNEPILNQMKEKMTLNNSKNIKVSPQKVNNYQKKN